MILMVSIGDDHYARKGKAASKQQIPRCARDDKPLQIMNDQPAHCGEAAKITLRRGERGDDNGKGDRLAGFTGPAKGPATKGGPEAASRRKANSRSLAALGMTFLRGGDVGR
jgi:hypothetical protein